MEIMTIFGQRVQSYEGEHAPELLAAVDEYTNDDNPDYLIDEMWKFQKGVDEGEFEFVKYMTFDVDDKEFNRVFFGETLSARVKE